MFIGLLRFICKTIDFKTWNPDQCFIRDTLRDMLLLANNDTLISEEEILLLYDLNKSRNLKLPYWSYDQFDLNLLTDDECMSGFRF